MYQAFPFLFAQTTFAAKSQKDRALPALAACPSPKTADQVSGAPAGGEAVHRKQRRHYQADNKGRRAHV